MATLLFPQRANRYIHRIQQFSWNCKGLPKEPSQASIRLRFLHLVSLLTFYMSDRGTSVKVSKENTQPALNLEISSLTINRSETMEEVFPIY